MNGYRVRLHWKYEMLLIWVEKNKRSTQVRFTGLIHHALFLAPNFLVRLSPFINPLGPPTRPPSLRQSGGPISSPTSLTSPPRPSRPG